MVEFNGISNELWNKIEPTLTGNEGSHGGKAYDNRDFIDSVLRLVYEKERLSSRLYWANLDKGATYNKRFTNWRREGRWEKLLSVLIQHEECYWLANPHKYEVLLKNYELITLLNQTYLFTADDVELTEEEAIKKVQNKYPNFMRKRNRRLNSASKSSRGAYKVKCTAEEIEYFKDLSG